MKSLLFNLYKFENLEISTPESYKMHWNLMNDQKFGSKKVLKLKYRREDQIIQTFCKIGSPQKLGRPSLICKKSSSFMQNWLKSNEWRRIWVHRTFKIEIQKAGPNNPDILQNWFPTEIRSPLLNLLKFGNPERTTPISYKWHWKLINGEKFGSKKLLQFKYRRGDQIIQTFWKIGSPQKLNPPSLICTNLRTLREVLVNHTKCIEI